MHLTLPFNVERGKEGDFYERMDFWDSPTTVEWFKERGYILYQRVIEYGDRTAWVVPTSMPLEERVEAQYPYAYYDTEMVNEYAIPLREDVFSGKVAFAQDSFERHVAIKIVRNESDEFRILEFLKSQSVETLRDNCVIPVLDLLPIEGFSFAIMPRWGPAVMHPPPQTIGQLLPIVHSLLKGLAFLHMHNISHGDINIGNVLTNHFADYASLSESNMRQELRSQGLLSYALFDFDFSVRWPPDADRTTCRLPYYNAWGTFNLVADVAQGEFDYDPFAFDVGVLGVLICSFAQHLTGRLPMLAPLLDKMTTRNLAKRFTAAEALCFFEEMASPLTKSELDQSLCYTRMVDTTPYHAYDRWRDVPPDFAKKWAAFKEPPIPWTTMVLRRLCRYAWVCHIIAHVRWIITWVAKLSEKEHLLKDISFTVLQIHDLLHPFTSTTSKRDGTGEYQLSQSIRSVGSILRRIEEHMEVYKLKKTQKILAFLNPGAVIQKLKDDQTQLNHQLVILIASIGAVGYFRDHARDSVKSDAASDNALAVLTERLEISTTEEGEGSTVGIVKKLPSSLDDLQTEDAKEFWRDYVDFATTDLFRARLVSWSKSNLSSKACDLIVMRLDEFNAGVITPQNLARALGKQSLRSFLDTYIENDLPSEPPAYSTIIPRFNADSSELRLPLLVWIDDRPDNNLYEVDFARSMGVQVIQLLSTAEAKAWVEENDAFLRKYDDRSRIRFISDNVRLETAPVPWSSTSDGGTFLNASAGQNLLQYLRGRLIRAPVLIYTGLSVEWTRFVEKYDAAGSTTNPMVCMAYISSLAAGEGRDREWERFKADGQYFLDKAKAYV